jgi:ketosteroid isomerase-like protein
MNGSQDPANESSSPTDASRLARRYVDAYMDQDLGALLAATDEEVVWHPTVFGHGPYFGHEGVRQWWRAMIASSRQVDVVVSELRQLGGDRAAVLGALHDRGSGKPLGPWALIVRVRNGRIVEARSYLDDHDALEERGLL